MPDIPGNGNFPEEDDHRVRGERETATALHSINRQQAEEYEPQLRGCCPGHRCDGWACPLSIFKPTELTLTSDGDCEGQRHEHLLTPSFSSKPLKRCPQPGSPLCYSLEVSLMLTGKWPIAT